ncbi:DUF4097 family beta strand repeat-containing protein [Ferrimonas marina]|uniref:Putative adhesin n=1 Tax=Ferrimonas marina TaxID=299255 RepID=A0A1M5ZGX7_9GAMM|nr:DUF4097 family beta strand repeat-containing protein [Ferrimonas marina]SHI23173.1 Putative adhesin [Ferrimonas marina]
MLMRQLGLALMMIPLTLQAQEVDQRLTVSGDTPITITVPRGQLVITGADGDEVRVLGQVDQHAEAFIFEQQQDELVIEVKLPEGWSDRGTRSEEHSNLRITLPRSVQVQAQGISTDMEASGLTQLKLNGVSSDIKVSAGEGRFDLQSVSGDLTLTELAGEVRGEAVSGDIRGENLKGELRLRAVSGDLRLSEVSGDLALESVSGDIQVSGQSLSRLHSRSVSGDVALSVSEPAPGLELSLETVSGDAKLKLAEPRNLELAARTGPGGSIRNGWSSDKPTTTKYARNEELNLTLGQGEASVRLNTVSGDLRLEP